MRVARASRVGDKQPALDSPTAAAARRPTPKLSASSLVAVGPGVSSSRMPADRGRRQPDSESAPELLETITNGARLSEHKLPPDASRIVGLWVTEYAVQLRPESTPLHLKHVCVETDAIGTCYFERKEPEPAVDENLLGKTYDAALLSKYWKIAALDAVYGAIIRSPDEKHTLRGSAGAKAYDRATIVCDEVRRIASESQARHLRVVNVGVVGDFLAQLTKERRFEVQATDFYEAIINNTVHGVRVKSGRFTERAVAEADVALVTGMTLANDTLDGIMEVARANNTQVILFAETGSNFAEIYLAAGATAVVAESYPFYLSGSESCDVRVYRRT